MVEFIFRFYDDFLYLTLFMEIISKGGDYSTNEQMMSQPVISTAYQLTKINLMVIYPIMTFMQSGEVLLLLYLVARDNLKRSTVDKKERRISFQ